MKKQGKPEINEPIPPLSANRRKRNKADDFPIPKADKKEKLRYLKDTQKTKNQKENIPPKNKQKIKSEPFVSEEEKSTLPSLFERIANFDIELCIKNRLARADKPFWTGFTVLLLSLSLIFLYHGGHFLFGDHDWQYLKNGVQWGAGLFEGRFSQFMAINILSKGEIYPIINNILGFIGFSLGCMLLARYWQIPHNKRDYVLFGLFCGITPYILSFMYFSFLVIPVLSWNAFVIGGLLLSYKEEKFSWKKSLGTITLITLALGGYPAIINLIGVAISIKMLSDSLELGKSQNLPKVIKTLIKRYKWSVINILISLGCYKLCLWGLELSGNLNTSYYNLQTTPLSEWGDKFLLVSKDVVKQLSATLPFITREYKLCTGIMVVLGLMAISCQIWNKQQKNIGIKCLQVIICIGCFYAPLVTLFISTSIQETEFSPRIDFFGLMYLYAGMYALIQKARDNCRCVKNLSYVIAIMSIIISCNNLFEAQKVWKLGFESEKKLYQRIGPRFMSSPTFSFSKKYIMVQGGSPSFRPRFYHEKYRHKSDDLLSISYTPGMNSGVMWNYYAPQDFAETTSYVYQLRPTLQTAQKIKQVPLWPDKRSVIQSAPSWEVKINSEKDESIISDTQSWIMIIFSEEARSNIRRSYVF